MSHRPNPGEEPVHTIDNPPPPPASPEQRAEAAWQEMQASPSFSEALFGHCRPQFLERTPIRLYGLSGPWFLYRDAKGDRRALKAEDHDRVVIASLFDGAEGWLCRLWPAPDGGWDDERAAATLMHFSACVGIANPKSLGFDLPPEPIE